MLKVLSSILCDLNLKVKVIGQKAGICDGVPSTSALVKTCKYLFVLQIRQTGNSYFRFQKKMADIQSRIIVVKYLKWKAQIQSFLLEKQPRDRRSS